VPSAPIVSVLLAVHNGEASVADAVRSVLAQTWTDWELVVVDDASTDATPAVLASFTDARLRTLRNPHNLGLTRSLNLGLRASRGRYIARLDADDTCHPDRLARQVAYLDAHPGVGLLGSAARVGEEVRRGPQDPTELRWWLLFDNIFIHSSVMFRADLVREHGYDESFPCAQDYALWSSWAECTGLALLPDPWVTLGTHAGQISQRRAAEQRALAERISLGNLSRCLGRPVTAAERDALRRVFPRPPTRPAGEDLRACRLCLDLFRAFSQRQGVQAKLARRLRRTWVLRALNSLCWDQRADLWRSGLLAAVIRASPGTFLWYLAQRWRARSAAKSPSTMTCL
jgi:hypothetical protein